MTALVWAASPLSAQTPGASLDLSPVPAEVVFDEARSLYDGDLYGPAERAFARFLDRHPRHLRVAEALYYRADAALLSDDPVLAAALFGQFETDFPGHPLAASARLALGRYYFARGDDERAEDALNAALARPGPPALLAEAAYLLGLTHRRQGRTDAAVAAFERAAQDETPTAPAALYALGTLHLNGQRWERSAGAFSRLQARYPASPENAQAGLALAESLVRAGQLAQGADEADRRRPTLDRDGADRAALLSGESRLRLGDARRAEEALAEVSADSRFARRAALARGRALLMLGEPSTSIDLFRVAYAGRTEPEDDAVAHEARYYEGIALKATGRLGEAADRFQETYDRRPDGGYAEAALLELGVLRYERRQYAEAASSLRTLIDLNPRGPYAGEAARMLGEAYASNNQPGRAREAFQLAETLGTATAGTRAEVAFQDAYAIFRDGRYADAIIALIRVAASDPAGPRAGEALFWAGESAFLNREYARAEEILADFLRGYPGHARSDAARYVLAWTYFRRRDYARAADAFERFLSAYTRSGELVPYYADALLRLGDAYSVLGRYQEARLVYARVPSATPDRQGGDYALYQTAQAFGREGRGDDAIATYDRILREYPQSELYAQSLLAQGALRSARGEDSLAVASYERLLQERPSSPAAPAALLGIADVRTNQGDLPRAEATYRRVLDRYPSSPLTADAFGGLADVLDQQDRGEEIDIVFREVDGRLGDVEARSRLRYARAQVALVAGEDSVAVVFLEETLAGSPPPDLEADALLALAGAYASLGRRPDAIRTLRRLLARAPDGPLAAEAQLRLADALFASGDLDGARAAAALLVSRYPTDEERAADALVIEAQALRALGRPDEADDRLRLLLQRYPDAPAAPAVREQRPDLAPGSPPEDAP
ncbi:MAG: tetratricopeptide repeat protein [Bacteroidota bacterium]